jgi:hypothetical protein
MLLIFRIKTWLIFDLMHHIISTFKKIDDANSSTFLAETRNYIVENCWQKTSFLLYSQPLDDLMQQAPTLENLTTIAYQLFLEKVHPISS